MNGIEQPGSSGKGAVEEGLENRHFRMSIGRIEADDQIEARVLGVLVDVEAVHLDDVVVALRQVVGTLHGVVACLFGVDDAPNRLLQRGNTCPQDDDGNFALTPRPKPSKGFSAASAVTV